MKRSEPEWWAKARFMRISGAAGGKKPPSYGELGKIFGRSRHTVRRACQVELRRKDAIWKRSKASKFYLATYKLFGRFAKWPAPEKRTYMELCQKQRDQRDGRAQIRAPLEAEAPALRRARI
jgi:hypothetical protein